MRPSKRWAKTKHKVIWPMVGVTTLSSLSVAYLYNERLVGAPLGLAFVFAMPFVISTLLGLLMRRRSNAKTALMVAGVHAATVITSALAGGEGAICLFMATPVLFGLTFATTLATQALWRARLGRADKKHRALLAVIIALVVPHLAPRIDALVYGRWLDNEQERSTLSSQVTLPLSQTQVWQSLEALKVQFARPELTFIEEMLPVPVSITGEGARLGARRRIQFENGAVLATVEQLDEPRSYTVALEVVEPGVEFYDHWIDLKTSHFELRVNPDDENECIVVHSTTYRPLMYPRVVFEPIERVFGRIVQQRLLDVYAAQVLRQLQHPRGASAELQVALVAP